MDEKNKIIFSNLLTQKVKKSVNYSDSEKCKKSIKTSNLKSEKINSKFNVDKGDIRKNNFSMSPIKNK